MSQNRTTAVVARENMAAYFANSCLSNTFQVMLRILSGMWDAHQIEPKRQHTWQINAIVGYLPSSPGVTHHDIPWLALEVLCAEGFPGFLFPQKVWEIRVFAWL